MEEVRHMSVLDPGLQHLGTVYAKALLGATENAGNTDQVMAELGSLIEDVLDRLPSFEAALVSPRVPFESKERMLDRVFQKQMSRELLNFVKVLARRGRFEAVRSVQIAARRLLNELRGRVEVHLSSAAPIDAATNQLILAKLKANFGRDVDLRTRVDPDLIGGIVIRVGDTVYNGSISNQLQQLRGELVARAATTLRSQTDRFTVAN